MKGCDVMSIRAGIYVRVSTDDQRDNGYSIDSQMRMINFFYITSHHFRSEKVYTFGKFSPEKMLISGCFSPEKMLIY